MSDATYYWWIVGLCAGGGVIAALILWLTTPAKPKEPCVECCGHGYVYERGHGEPPVWSISDGAVRKPCPKCKGTGGAR